MESGGNYEASGDFSEGIASETSHFEVWEQEFTPTDQERISVLNKELGRLSLSEALVPPSEDVIEANELETEIDYFEEEQQEPEEREYENLPKSEKKKQSQSTSHTDTTEQTRQAAYELIFMTTAVPVEELTS